MKDVIDPNFEKRYYTKEDQRVYGYFVSEKKKLEVELSYKESKFSRQIYSGGFVTFKQSNLCPTCKQPKLTSTLAE